MSTYPSIYGLSFVISYLETNCLADTSKQQRSYSSVCYRVSHSHRLKKRLVESQQQVVFIYPAWSYWFLLVCVSDRRRIIGIRVIQQPRGERVVVLWLQRRSVNSHDRGSNDTLCNVNTTRPSSVFSVSSCYYKSPLSMDVSCVVSSLGFQSFPSLELEESDNPLQTTHLSRVWGMLFPLSRRGRSITVSIPKDAAYMA